MFSVYLISVQHSNIAYNVQTIDGVIKVNMSKDTYVEENVPLFEAIYGKGLISLGGFQAINSMFEGLDLRNKTLLDVGSGIGGMVYHLADKYRCDAIGLEIQRWMADYATKHTPQSIRNHVNFITYTPGGIIPVNDQSVDICCSKGVLTNVEDKLTLFRELYRVLNQQGQIVLIDWLVPESIGPQNNRLRLGDMSFKETPSGYSAILEKAGFNHIQFIDKSQEYLGYVAELDDLYHSVEHQQTFENIISNSLRHDLIQANNDLRNSIESGEQLSMRILANK